MGEETLHPIRGSFSGVFGQLPAIFALDATEQTLQIAERPASGFWPGKARGNPAMQLAESLCPVHEVSERRSGSYRYGMLLGLHGLLLSLAVSEGGIHTYRVSQVNQKITKCFSEVLLGSIVQLKKCNCSASRHPPIFPLVKRGGSISKKLW